MDILILKKMKEYENVGDNIKKKTFIQLLMIN
jgi:hypothetical protein